MPTPFLFLPHKATAPVELKFRVLLLSLLEILPCGRKIVASAPRHAKYLAWVSGSGLQAGVLRLKSGFHHSGSCQDWENK